MNCIDCKFFNRLNSPHTHLGACEIELPPWLTRHVEEVTISVSRTVRLDDGCDMHVPKDTEK